GFQVLDRKHVAVAYHQIDIVERDAFGRQAVVDDPLVEAGRMLLPRDPLLADRECDGTVTKKARADVMVIGIDAEHVAVSFGHWNSCERQAFVNRSAVGGTSLRVD